MNAEEQRTAALRCIERAVSELTPDVVRAHLGFDPGFGQADVEAVTYLVQLATHTVPPLTEKTATPG